MTDIDVSKSLGQCLSYMAVKLLVAVHDDRLQIEEHIRASMASEYKESASDLLFELASHADWANLANPRRFLT